MNGSKPKKPGPLLSRKKQQDLAVTAKINLKDFDATVKEKGEKDEGLEKLMAYAFSNGGTLLESVPFKAGTDAKFVFSKQLLGKNVNILIAPDPVFQEPCPPWMGDNDFRDKIAKLKPTIRSLKFQGAQEARYVIGSTGSIEMEIAKEHWEHWFTNKCKVKGRVVRRYTLDDGSTKDLGLRYGCVHIYEVDAFLRLVERLPLEELLRLRDDLRFVFEEEPIPGPPDPGPYFEKSASAFIPKFKLDTTKIQTKTMAMLPDSAKKVYYELFSAGTDTNLRRAFITHAEYLGPYSFQIEWLYHYYQDDWIACACVDEQGYFEGTIPRSIGGDKPDLYFRVNQYANGAFRTVYDPGIRGNVHWNYVCGTHVLLVTNDMGAVVSEPSTDYDTDETTFVAPHGIGDYNLSQIHSDGLLYYTDESKGRPFGEILSFRCGFSRNIPTNDIYGYRMYYRKVLEGTEEADWTRFDRSVTRHYVHEYEENGRTRIAYPTVALGPIAPPETPTDPSADAEALKPLFRFKPSEPSMVDGCATTGTTYWPSEDWFDETFVGYLDTRTFSSDPENDPSHGTYEIKIVVVNSKGEKVVPGTRYSFIIPTEPDTENAPTETEEVALNECANGYVFKIQVDNRPCVAAIDAPEIGLAAAGDDCGILKYQNQSNDIEITYTADHLDHHAVFSFTLKRGNNALNGSSPDEPDFCVTQQPVGQNAEVYTHDEGDYFVVTPVSEILGECKHAAYAEHVYVWATATNGRRRLNEYDASALRAFALMKSKKKLAEAEAADIEEV